MPIEILDKEILGRGYAWSHDYCCICLLCELRELDALCKLIDNGDDVSDDDDGDDDGQVMDSLVVEEAYKVLFTRLELIIHQKALACT